MRRRKYQSRCPCPSSGANLERVAQVKEKQGHNLRGLKYTITYSLTPWCRVILEQLTGLQLVKKFARISRNPKVHYRTHKCPPPVSILGQPNQIHIPTSHLLQIHPNIIHPSTPRSPQWSPSLRFLYININLLTHSLHGAESFLSS